MNIILFTFKSIGRRSTMPFHGVNRIQFSGVTYNCMISLNDCDVMKIISVQIVEISDIDKTPSTSRHANQTLHEDAASMEVGYKPGILTTPSTYLIAPCRELSIDAAVLSLTPSNGKPI